MSKPQLKTFDSKEKTQKAQKHKKLVLQKKQIDIDKQIQNADLQKPV